MVLYIFGKISHIGDGYIILERRGEGLMLKVPDTRRLKVDDFKKIYTYKHITEYRRNSYGFLSFKEWILFQDFIKLAGIGPKLAFTLLDQGVKKISLLIAKNDIQGLAKIPMISEKIARQIVIQLSEKCKSFLKNQAEDVEKILKEGNNFHNDLKENLKKLGFQNHQIDLAIKKNDELESIDLAIQKCIKIISNHVNK